MSFSITLSLFLSLYVFFYHSISFSNSMYFPLCLFLSQSIYLLVLFNPSISATLFLCPSFLSTFLYYSVWVFTLFCQYLCPVFLQSQCHGRAGTLYTVGPHGIFSYFITDEVPGIFCFFNFRQGHQLPH